MPMKQMTINDICPEVLKPCPICCTVPKLVRALGEQGNSLRVCRKLECECKLLCPNNRTYHFDKPSEYDIQKWNEEVYRITEILKKHWR